MYYIENQEELTLKQVKECIDDFKAKHLPRLEKLERYYQNNNDINRRYFEDSTKPNHKISHNFAEYITKTNVSLLVGAPVSYSGENLEEFSEILESTDEHDINVDLAVDCSKFGYGVQTLCYTENGIKLYIFDPRQILLFYSLDIDQKLLGGVRFWSHETSGFGENEYLEIYTSKSTKIYKNDVLIEEKPNIFGEVPLVVYKNNSDKTGDYEKVLKLIDEYDLLTSDTANENAYFNNCYLFLNTDSVEEDDIKRMKESRILFGSELNPEFILKGTSPDIESEKDRIVSDIHKLSFVPDLADENFANNVSGVAMRYKLFGALNNIASKQRKFKKAISHRNRLIFMAMELLNIEVPSNLKMTFTTNLPQDHLEQAQMINQLRGMVSDRTLISLLSFVESPEDELESVASSNSLGDVYE